EGAMASAAAQRFSVATDEIIKGLHDPSPRIRRQAASSLARLGDPKAVAALTRQLEEHPDLVAADTVEARGDLRHASAVPPLLRRWRRWSCMARAKPCTARWSGTATRRRARWLMRWAASARVTIYHELWRWPGNASR